MSKITQAIPPQKFEYIRDKIAFILADELAAQAILQADDLLSADVWTERFIPFNLEEIPALKVYYVGSTFEALTPTTNKAKTRYFIDIFTKAKKEQNGKNSGDYYSALKNHKLVGVCLAILQNPSYISLDFPLDFGIENRQVTDINISEPEQKIGDGANTYTARITLTVDVVEDVFDLQPIAAEGYTTAVSIGESDKGYKIELNN